MTTRTPDDHLDETALARFAHGTYLWEEMIEAGIHLFHCRACREALTRLQPERGPRVLETIFRGEPPQDLFGDSQPAAALAAYRQLVAAGKGYAAELARGIELAGELLRFPASKRKLLVQSEGRFHSWSLAEELLDLGKQTWNEDPSRSEELGELALEIAESLVLAASDKELLNDLRAKAWTYIANARRIRSDLRGVDEAFGIAEGFLAEGTADGFELARFCDLKASFLRDQRKFPEASTLLEQAMRLYREGGDQHLEGRCLVKKATIERERGESAQAIVLLYQAQALIDMEREPRLLLCCHQHLVDYLAQTGRVSEAELLLPELLDLAARHGSHLDLIRTYWLQGLLCQKLGQDEAAEGCLLNARQGFVELGIGYDAALVSLDLAGMYLQAGRTDEVRALVREMLPIFQSRDVHREAVAALALFQHAVEVEQATASLASELSEYLQRARKNPALRFQADF